MHSLSKCTLLDFFFSLWSRQHALRESLLYLLFEHTHLSYYYLSEEKTPAIQLNNSHQVTDKQNIDLDPMQKIDIVWITRCQFNGKQSV